MRLRSDQLAAHLLRPLAPVYVVSGDEPLQFQESLDAIRATARAQGYDDRVVLEVDSSFDWSELRQYQDSLSLFAQRRIIEIRMPGGKPGREGGAALKDYATRPAEETLLLIGAAKFDNRDASSAWYRAIEQTGAAVQVWPIAVPRLPGWIQTRAKDMGVQLDRDGVAALAERGEGNLLAIVQELEKLILLHGEGPIDTDAVIAAASDSARFNVFDLAGSALLGDASRCVRIVRGLAEEGVAAPVVSWSLAREVRSVAAVSADCARGESTDAALKKHGIWRNREAGVKAAVRRLPPQRWLDLLGEAAQADRIVKGAPGDPWDALERLALGMCGVTILPSSPNLGT